MVLASLGGKGLRKTDGQIGLSGAGRIEKLVGQNVGGSGDMLPRENFENSYFLEWYFLHLQEPFKTFTRSR